MKIKETKTITLYEYSELSPEAKQKALDAWNEHNDDPYMQSHMINLLKEKLEEEGIEYDTDSMDVRYSLSHCQGDGFMFEGVLTWKGYTVTVKHHGHYYHSYSKVVEITNDEGIAIESYKTDAEAQAVSDAFEALYQQVCKHMEQQGYAHIEYITSEESFIEECDANGYTFRENGMMENENEI